MTNIPYARQEINQADIDAVVAVLRSNFLITGGKFPAPWGVTVFLGDERIHTQEPQRDGADVPLGVSCEVSKSGI